ncbi:hypothetical protein C8R44DRAFT_744887 [Mycena epipterygia]|nr:hypothetical protein C8R44DRAFT_744887 [Mycena epipterygia]
MPHQTTVTEIRLNSIISCLTPAVRLLNEINDVFGTPFIRAISSTTISLITAVQNVKRNKEECIQFMENTHGILYTIIALHLKSETAGSLPPATLDHIGKFTEYLLFYRTLHKIHTFLESQQDGNKIKYFFRQNEINTLRKDCHIGLEEAVKLFKVETGLIMANNIAKIQQNMKNMHQELLELVGNLSDGTTSDRSSSIYQITASSKNRWEHKTTRPKIFHGRQSELEGIVTSLVQQSTDSAHIAILGAGGIGKTSLARAALHHPQVAAKYEHRFFVAADSATTSIELAGLMGSHLGLKPGKDLTKAVIQFLSRGPPCLMVLDNLETPWEPSGSRGGVEDFLSLLTDIAHLALIITMQGAERPAKVRWTRPFLEPLKPLSYEAARQTFFDIADNFHDSKDVDRLLHLTDNMPLAVDLIANLVDYEGCSGVLARWEMEKTSLLSMGHDKWSSLDASIVISLTSPRMASCPGAKDLLSLLSILPDGLSDAELIQSDLPIQDMLGCRATLLRTSLAYFDDNKRIKSLVPIREHIFALSPPSPPLFHPLRKYFHTVMNLSEKYHGAQQNTARINQITSNLSNLHQLLLFELHSDNADLADAINCTISLNSFRRLAGHTYTPLMDCIPALFAKSSDPQTQAKYVVEILRIQNYQITDLELLRQQAIADFHHFNDPVLESNFYLALGHYYHHRKNDMSAAAQSLEKGVSLAKLSGDSRQTCIALQLLSQHKETIGHYISAQMDAKNAQQLAQLSGDLYQEAGALAIEAVCLSALGNLKETAALTQQARDLLHLCGMQGGLKEQRVTSNLAEIHRIKSEYLEAHSIYIDLAKNASYGQDLFHSAYSRLGIAETDIMIGADVVKVQQNLDSAKMIFTTLKLPTGLNHCETILAELHLREGNSMIATSLLQQCLKVAWGKDLQAVSFCLERLADVGRCPVANINWLYKWPVIYLVQAQQTQEKLALHKALRFLGDVFLSEGDENTAHNLFVVALEGFTYMDIHCSRANCMLRLGDIAKHRGHVMKAAEIWREARPLFERSSQAKDVAQIDTRLASVNQDMQDTHQKTLGLLSKLEAPITSLTIKETVSQTPERMPVEY